MARYYNSENGVFLSLDPAGGDLRNPINLNGYNYVDNNPVMFIDPIGENPALIPIFGLILRFAIPLIRKYGVKQLRKLEQE